MFHRRGGPADFTHYLLDDEFISRINGFENPGEYINYINDLKKANPEQDENIDKAVEIFFRMKNIHPEANFKQRQKIWNNITAVRTRESRILFLRVAASIIILVGLGIAAYYLYNKHDQPAIEKFALSTKPAFNQSQLILSDGKNILISDYQSKVAYSSDGAKVIINDTTEVIQEVRNENFNQMIVPYGKYNSLTLSDGTKVWLNSGSRLVYPPVFVGMTREVYVQGEAYFEVTYNVNKPFYVKTDRFRVEAVGTKFSVQANDSEGLFTALLLEGEVSLTSGKDMASGDAGTKLKPGYLASLDEEKKKFDVRAVEHPENYIAWKNGYLIFDDEPLSEILHRVSRYYHIDVELANPKIEIRISGKLDLKDDPERVLKGISIIAKCKLQVENGKYILY